MVSQLDMNVSAKKKIWAKLKIFCCQLAFTSCNCHVESSYSNSRLLTIHPPTFIAGKCVRHISKLLMLRPASKVVWDLLNRDISAFDRVLHRYLFRRIHAEGTGISLRLRRKISRMKTEEKQIEKKPGMEADARTAKPRKCRMAGESEGH
jgi:hypothetical protein